MTEPLLQLALRDQHVRAGARFAPFAGWEMPLQYAGIVQEHHAVRDGVGIFDVSHMGRVRVEGSGIGEQIRAVTTGDVRRLRPGRARYSLYCNDSGGITDDVMVYRVTEERWLLVHNAANAAAGAQRLSAAAGASATDVTLRTAMFAVQGPEAARPLREVLGIDLASVRKRGALEVEWQGSPVLFGRTGYTGEDGGECVVDIGVGGRLWDAFVDAGVTPAGLGARDTLRLEAALPLHGHEITPETHPYEAGLGFAVDLEDGTPFTGREALVRLAAQTTERRLACLRLTGRGIPREGYAVFDPRDENSAAVAFLTSGGFSPTLGTGIGLAYLPDEVREPGTNLAVDVRGRTVPAVVVQRPFHRSERS